MTARGRCTGMTISQHKDVAMRLRAMRSAQHAIVHELQKCFPVSSRASKALWKLIGPSCDVDKLRSALEDAMYKEHGNSAAEAVGGTHVYYGEQKQ